MRQFITGCLFLVLASGITLAEELPDGIGVVAPNGSVFTTEILNVGTDVDTDDYVFQGFPGMTLTASVKNVKGSTLVPDVRIIRPGGQYLGDENGLSLTLTSKSAIAKVVLDATGWWKVRVLGANSSVGKYSVSIKYTAPSLATLPRISKNFALTGAISTVGDTDDFQFQGYDTQTVSATLTVPKTGTLDPMLVLTRPDGTVATTLGQGTLEKKVTLASTLDADGVWTLRVVGESPTPTQADPHPDATTGAYSLSVKFGKAPKVGLVPDSNGQYRVTIPGVAGATIGYSLTSTGSTPTFNALVDPTGVHVSGFPGGKSVKAFVLKAGAPLGEYALTFDAPSGTQPTNVQITRTLKLPRSAPKRVVKLSAKEPLMIAAINPPTGGPGTTLTVKITNAIDEFFPLSTTPSGNHVSLSLDHTPLTGVALSAMDGVSVSGEVPDTLPQGIFDVAVFTTSGQPAALAKGFERVPPPKVADIDPRVGPSGGNFEIVITGSNFRSGQMGLTIDDALIPVTPTFVSDTVVKFVSPPWTPTTVTYGVRDRGTQLSADLPINSFEYTATAAISRIVPALIPVLGNEIITIQGANFDPTDKVYLEDTPSSGLFTEISLTQTTYVNFNKHQFLAPVRPKGVYEVYVTDQFGAPSPRKSRLLTYFSYANVVTNLGTLGNDKYEGYATAIGDFNGDTRQDLFVSKRGDQLDTVASTTSMTRVLRNDGNGVFADVTATTMPATGVDDWRADRIWATDINQDGLPDLVLTTNTVAVPTAGISHVRILVNEQRGGSGPNAADRVFRDRTIDLMAPPRTMQKYGVFGGSAEIYVSDDWRGLDMWLGDLDKGPAGPPEILITHQEVKDDDNPSTDVFSSGVYCGNYCSSNGAQQTFSYAYTFYWGGSRMFVWDKSARAGQGRYKFDPTFFPRKSGPVVPQGGVPGGATITTCSPHYNSICKGAFTPFTGKRIAVGNLDGDGKPDVAILSDLVVERRTKVNDTLKTTSSLQVGINKFNGADGAGITDVTDLIFNLGGDTKGDALAIGQPGFPGGDSYGVMAISKESAPGGGSVLRLIKFKPDLGIGNFEDITAGAMPPADSNEKFQASRLAWLDVDGDGDQDMVLLAPNAPGGTQSALLQILRNERVGTSVGVMKRTLDPLFALLVKPGEHLEGDSLSIGDVTGDGLIDYVVSRAVSNGQGAQTRIVRTDK